MTDRPLRARPAGPPAANVRGRSDGIGRTGSPASEAVSDALRRQTGSSLDARRRLAGLALGASAMLGVVAAYQTGLVRHLPDPPVPGFDSDAVDATGAAYRLGLTPDAALGMASYAVTLGLAAAGGADRATERPWLPLAVLAKVLTDAAGGLLLTAEQATRHRKFCGYCLAAAGLSVAMVPAALSEARTAWRALSGR